MSANIDYHSLPQHISDKRVAYSAKLFRRNDSIESHVTGKRRYVMGAFFFSLIVSVAVNGLLIYQRFYRPWLLSNSLPTQYAHLHSSVPTDVVPDGSFASTNRTIQDAAWSDPQLDVWQLFVALKEKYIISQGLPHSIRWPWDDRKGVYIPYGGHQMHCINMLRTYINEGQDLVPEENLSYPYGHAIHCLNVLRHAVMCYADDYPLYSGYLHANVYSDDPHSGRGQIKMCRDWSALMDWGRQNSACYSPEHNLKEGTEIAEIDLYKFCPNDARPWENERD